MSADPSASLPKASTRPPPTADSNELGSDLDESDDDLLSDDDGGDDDAEGPNMNVEGDVVVALWEKVHRVKNRYKVTLKDGVVSANGKDYIFNKLQG